MRVAVTTECKSLDKPERSIGSFSGNSNAVTGGAAHRRSSSHSDSIATPPKKLKRVSGGLPRPLSYDSLQSLDVATPKMNETTTSNQFAHQGMGALAACLLAGSCVGDMVEDPELGMLLVSGHADVLSAKICGLPRGLQQDSLGMGARQAPEVSSVLEDVSNGGDNDNDNPNIANQDAKPFATDSMPSQRPPEKKARVSLRALRTGGTGENMIVEFLRANSSPRADEASCLASSSLDEAPNIRTTPVTRYLRSSGYTKASLATSEILGSLEEDGIIPRGRQTVSRRTAQRPPSLS